MAFDGRDGSGYAEENRVVMVIGGRDFDPAEATESPVSVAIRSLWQRIKVLGVGALAVGVVGAYPFLAVQGHKVDTSPVKLTGDEPWAAPDAGVAITLIARELHGTGWVADKADWEPAARLRAMPAWQVGLASALSDYTALTATLASPADAGTDSDLIAASRLLRPVDRQDMTPRLMAAAEALARYEGRVDHGLALRLSSRDQVAQVISLFAHWNVGSAEALDRLVNQPTTWPASDQDIATFYETRARAHVAYNLLNALVESQPALTEGAALRAQVREVQLQLERISGLDPVFVNNAPGDRPLSGSHLAAMAYHSVRAAEASEVLAGMLRTADPDLQVAETGFSFIAASP